jgi:hypothetical protein
VNVKVKLRWLTKMLQASCRISLHLYTHLTFQCSFVRSNVGWRRGRKEGDNNNVRQDSTARHNSTPKSVFSFIFGVFTFGVCLIISIPRIITYEHSNEAGIYQIIVKLVRCCIRVAFLLVQLAFLLISEFTFSLTE